MNVLLALLRGVLMLMIGVVGLVFALFVLALIFVLVLVGVLWAWLQGRRANPGAQFAQHLDRHFKRSGAQVWMRGSWTFRTGSKPAAPDVVDVQAHEVSRTAGSEPRLSDKPAADRSTGT